MTVAGTRYEITVRGHLDDHWSERLGGFGITHCEDGTSILTGRVSDQARLLGVICGLRDIGAVLLAVRAVDHDAYGPSPASPSSRRALPMARPPFRRNRPDDTANARGADEPV